MELMRSQKNQLLEIVKNFDIDPFNFKWHKEDTEDGITSLLRYKDIEYLFGLKVYPGYFDWFTSPGEETMYEGGTSRSWDGVILRFHRWLVWLEREISQPDLWAELEKIKLFENVEFETENNIQQFTYQETLQIQEGINNIRKYLLEEVRGNTQEIKAINEKLDYIIDASKRMGRIDWKNIFVGTLVNIITSVRLNPEQGQVVVQLFKNAVTGIMRLVSAHGA